MPVTKSGNISALGFKPLMQHQEAKLNRLGPIVEHVPNVAIPEAYTTFLFTHVTFTIPKCNKFAYVTNLH